MSVINKGSIKLPGIVFKWLKQTKMYHVKDRYKMKKSILTIILGYLLVPQVIYPDEETVRYLWILDTKKIPIADTFSNSLRDRFEGLLQNCIPEKYVIYLSDTTVAPESQKTYNPSECAILFNKQADYLVRGKIWNAEEDSPYTISLRLYYRTDSSNIAVSKLRYNDDFVMEKKGIDMLASLLVSEICPAFKADNILQSAKIDQLINKKKMLVDNYKKIIDSLIQVQKKKDTLHLRDTIKLEVKRDTCIQEKKFNIIDTNLVNTLIPGYGLYKSISNREHLLHSTIVNFIELGTAACGGTFLIMAEQERNNKKSDLLKVYGSSCIATTAMTAIINSIIVAYKLKHNKKPFTTDITSVNN